MGSTSSIEVFSESDIADAYNENILGPKNESMIQFSKRMFKKSVEIITEPDRHKYDTVSLIPSFQYSNDFSIIEFDINSPIDNNIIHGAYWKNNNNNNNNNTCILYLHNNTRSIADAIEVIPLCAMLKCDLIAFDLPGFGKSSGKIKCNVTLEIDKVIAWYINATYSNDNDNNNNKIILWGRGMSTSHVIEYCHRQPELIKFIILDTPFISIERIIEDMKVAIGSKGLSNFLLNTFTKVGSKVYRNRVKDKLDMDLYDVKPIELVADIKLPCHILATSDDDYIPIEHARSIQEEWGGPCTIKNIKGNQFAQRSDEVLSCKEMVRHHLRISS